MADFSTGRVDGQGQFATPQSLDASKSLGRSAQGLDPSSFANEISGALKNLSGLDNSEKLRDDAIQNAKAIIKDWKPPTDAQITTILNNMRDELLA